MKFINKTFNWLTKHEIGQKHVIGKQTKKLVSKTSNWVTILSLESLYVLFVTLHNLR